MKPKTKLAETRQGRDIRQWELAAALNVARSTLAGVEAGHNKPWPKLRRDAARFLGVDESELFPKETP